MDDIDIEEHDVLDHPAIKNIFPDLSIIKREISSYEEQELPTKTDPNVISLSSQVSKCSNASSSDLDDIKFIEQAAKASFKEEKPIFENESSKDLMVVNEKAVCLDKDSLSSGNAIKITVEIQRMSKLTFEKKNPVLHNKSSGASIIENADDAVCSHSEDIASEGDTRSENEIKIVEAIQETSEIKLENDKLLLKNKIILGSKPTLQSNYEKYHYEQNIKSYTAKIYLNDISSYLDKSGRYCEICHILFPQKESLQNHTKTYHEISMNFKYTPSTLKYSNKNAAYTCEKCSQCFTNSFYLKQHMNSNHKQNFHKTHKPQSDNPLNRKSTLENKLIDSKTKSLSENKCFHCKKIFSSQKNLIEHIYKVLQSPKISQKTQLKLIKSKKMIKRYSNKDNLPNIRQISESTADTKWYYKCYYCSYYFNEKIFLTKHLVNKHKDKDIVTTNKKKFDPYCRFCSAIYSTLYSYNVHLQQQHKDMVNETFKIQPKLCLTKVELILAYNHNGKKIIQGESQITDINQSNENIQNFTEIEDNVSETAVDYFKDTEDTEEPKQIKRKRNINQIRKRKKAKVNERVLKQSNEQVVPNVIDSLVLKGILFKCKRCDINFLSNRCAMNHSEHMEFLINWKCQICLKIFKKHDEVLHKQQHSYSNEFVVYELSESKLSRVLYKCPKCAIHFDDFKYAFHFMHCGEIVTESVYCIACDILLEKNIMQSHEYEHKVNNQSLSDFTIITSDVIDSATFTVSKKTIKNETNSLYRKRKPSFSGNKKVDSLHMNYCNTCKCFVTHTYFRTVHKEARCAHMNKHICKYCGLVVTMQSMKSHRKMHKLDKDLKLQNFKFYDGKSNRCILPPIPEYPKCKSCDVRFLSKNAVLNHVCDDIEFLTCPICTIKLSDDAFKLHFSFHHYSLKSPNKDILNRRLFNENSIIKTEHPCLNSVIDTCKSENTCNEKNDINADDELRWDEIQTITQNSESIQKHSNNIKPVETSEPYNLITDNYKIIINSEQKTDLELYNVVYCCSYCFMTLVTYDQAVEHCQDHYYEVDISKNIDKCIECKMTYDRRFNDHIKIHHLRASRKTVTVLKFDAVYFAVDYQIWIKNLFELLDTDIRTTILNHSIYKYEGRVKLQLLKKGRTDLTVYKCSSCRMFVQPHAILSHIENSCFRLRKHACCFCGLPFVSHVFRMAHEKIHQCSSDLTVHSFNILIFNRDKDKEYNKKIIHSRNNFILYQCRKCKGLFERFQSREHDCNNHHLKQCPRCCFFIYNSEYKSHVVKHDLIESFTYDNMKIIRFGKYNKSNTASNSLPSKFNGIVKDYNFYRCTKCNLNFRKPQTLIKHDCVDTNAQVTCFKCDLNISKKDINQHFKIHDKDPYFVKENFNVLPYTELNIESPGSPNEEDNKVNEIPCLVKVVTEKKIQSSKEKTAVSNNSSAIVIKIAKIYKCGCGQHFLDKSSIISHFGYCKSKILKQTCTKCSLLFSSKHLFTHLLKHHGDKKYTYTFYVIPLNKRSKVIAIFNCSNCNLHFVEFHKAMEHISNCFQHETEGTECSNCKLFFENTSLHFHTDHHHCEDVADFDIVDIKRDSEYVENASLDTDIPNVTSQSDIATIANSKLENLSHMSLDCYSNNIYKCVDCNIHFLTEYSFRNHIHKDGYEISASKQKECELCGLNFSLPTLAKHINVHHYQMKLESKKIVIKTAIDDHIVCSTIDNDKV